MVRVLLSPVTTDNKFYSMLFSIVDRSTIFDEFAKRMSTGISGESGSFVIELVVEGKTLVACFVGQGATTPPECQNVPQWPDVIGTSIAWPFYAKDDITPLLQDAQLEFYATGEVPIRVGTGKLYPLIQDIPVETPDGIVLVGYESLTVDRFLDDNGNEVTDTVSWRLVFGFRRILGNQFSALLLTAAAVEVSGAGTGVYQIGPKYNDQLQPGFYVINSKGMPYRMFAFLDYAAPGSSPFLIVAPPPPTTQYNMEARLLMKMYLLNEDALQYTTGDFTFKIYDKNANLVDSLSDTFEEVAFIRYAGEPQPPPSRMSTLAPAP